MKDFYHYVLLYEPDKERGEEYKKTLENIGFKVDFLSRLERGFYQKKNIEKYNLLILDVNFSTKGGIYSFQKIKRITPDIPILVITDFNSIACVVEETQSSISDFLIKPFPLDKLGQASQRALEGCGQQTKKILSQTLLSKCEINLLSPPSFDYNFGRFIGTSSAMQVIYSIVESASRSDAPVFITGASGTGKEICAQALHYYSDRREGNFVPLNCGSFPAELFESALFGHRKGAFTNAIEDRIGAIEKAQNGTLFLDEICEMPAAIQIKILRFLQDYHYQKIGSDDMKQANIRIICATNKNPVKQIQKKLFRKDLYYRLHVIPIHMPDLKERGGDVLTLAEYFLSFYNASENKSFQRFEPGVENIFQSYNWSGNVRELQNVIRQIVVLYDESVVRTSMLPSHFQGNMEKIEYLSIKTSHLPLWKIEQRAIENTIQACDGNIIQAASRLKISPSTIYRKKNSWKKE